MGLGIVYRKHDMVLSPVCSEEVPALEGTGMTLACTEQTRVSNNTVTVLLIMQVTKATWENQ